MGFDQTKERILGIYRRKKRELGRIETRSLETPSLELRVEVAEAQGYLAGLRRALDTLETDQADNPLPGIE